MYETKTATAPAMTGARRKTVFAALLASSAMAFAVSTPAHADKAGRAREAIAAAEAKIHTAESIGAGSVAPGETAEARAALATAKENLASGHKSSSIEAAIRASALADTAIGASQRVKDDTVAAAQDAQREGVSTAQQQAAEANARADAAQQSAASSAADAAAARSAAALAAQAPPAQVETTVTTQQPGSTRRSTRTHVTRRATSPAPAPSGEVTTTTKVTQP